MSLLNIKIKRSLEKAYESCNDKNYNIFDHSSIIANEMYESDVKEHTEEMKRINKIISSSNGNRVHLWNLTTKNLGKLNDLYVPFELVENLVTETRHSFIKNNVIKNIKKEPLNENVPLNSNDVLELPNVTENKKDENWNFVSYVHEQMTLHEL